MLMKKFFTMIGAALMMGSFAAQAESEIVNVEVQDYYDQDIAKSFDSELIKNEDGSLTFTNFFNSGYPMSFTFKEPSVGGYADIIVAGNLDTSDTWPYLLTPDGNYMVCYAYPVKGDEAPTTIMYPYVADTQSYSWVYRYSANEPYEYYGSICLSGFLEDGTTSAPWYYLNFFFNIPETSGVKAIESADAPAEFYNLNGVRVNNPSKGLFICKQGNQTKKVILK